MNLPRPERSHFDNAWVGCPLSQEVERDESQCLGVCPFFTTQPTMFEGQRTKTQVLFVIFSCVAVLGIPVLDSRYRKVRGGFSTPLSRSRDGMPKYFFTWNIMTDNTDYRPQPFRDFNCGSYSSCLMQAALVNGKLVCKGCNNFKYMPRRSEWLSPYLRLLRCIFFEGIISRSKSGGMKKAIKEVENL